MDAYFDAGGKMPESSVDTVIDAEQGTEHVLDGRSNPHLSDRTTPAAPGGTPVLHGQPSTGTVDALTGDALQGTSSVRSIETADGYDPRRGSLPPGRHHRVHAQVVPAGSDSALIASAS